MLKSGYIAIIGRPNSGKSSLLNAVLGTEVSIVTPKAQTTRDRIQGILAEENKGQIVFMDTPGIHRARKGGINEYMVAQAKESLEAPNLIWYIVDPHSSLEHEKTVIELLHEKSAPVILIFNKIDLISNPDRLEADVLAALQQNGVQVHKTFKISALKRAGVKELVEESWSQLPEGPLYFPDTEQVSDRPTRFFVAEKIRGRLFYCLGDEIPYSCAVEITRFDEAVKPTRIEAVIHVERDSQKGMVIGKGGQKIKEIGQSARADIEKFLGSHVFLGLKVNVLKNWSQDAETLKKIGYCLPPRGKS